MRNAEFGSPRAKSRGMLKGGLWLPEVVGPRADCRIVISTPVRLLCAGFGIFVALSRTEKEQQRFQVSTKRRSAETWNDGTVANPSSATKFASPSAKAAGDDLSSPHTAGARNDGRYYSLFREAIAQGGQDRGWDEL